MGENICTIGLSAAFSVIHILAHVQKALRKQQHQQS